METTKQDVEVLLENFDDYVNPAGDEDPWFTLDEINQQFAWDARSHPTANFVQKTGCLFHAPALTTVSRPRETQRPLHRSLRLTRHQPNTCPQRARLDAELRTQPTSMQHACGGT